MTFENRANAAGTVRTTVTVALTPGPVTPPAASQLHVTLPPSPASLGTRTQGPVVSHHPDSDSDMAATRKDSARERLP